MSKPKVITFNITPQTWVPYQQSSTVLFRIPEECKSRHRVTGLEEDKGLPCDMYSEENPYCKHYDEEKEKWINHTLSKDGRYKKKRIERYNKYRDDLRQIAEEKKFFFPHIGLGIMFYLPVSVRWSKVKKRHHHLSWHDYTPDLSNLLKAFEDALMPQDKFVGHYSHLGKKWVNFEQGWIEATLPTRDELLMYGVTEKSFSLTNNKY